MDTAFLLVRLSTTIFHNSCMRRIRTLIGVIADSRISTTYWVDPERADAPF
jgi:hypothetical protein